MNTTNATHTNLQLFYLSFTIWNIHQN